tara:strand:- start:489 stop:1148 length:660 start_codon:yes stop_codon:yes gene_type:complete
MKLNIAVPESLEEITLDQYQKFVKIDIEENQNTNFLMHKTVEIFCNLDLKDLVSIKMIHIKNILNTLNKIFEKKNNLIPTFNLNNVEYGFIPALDDMTLGEYIDLDDNMTDWDKMHKAMAVLYRPIVYKKNERYKIEDYTGKENTEIFKQMPLNIVMGAMVFFYNLNSELLEITLNYLKAEVAKDNTEVMKILEKSGDGSHLFTDSAAQMFPKLNISLN